MTGHKLQGRGIDCLFVHNWSYVTNWVYVKLLRVKTRMGLYCRKPISTDLRKYAVPEALARMMVNFLNRLATSWTEEEYEEIFTCKYYFNCIAKSDFPNMPYKLHLQVYSMQPATNFLISLDTNHSTTCKPADKKK